MLACAGHKWIGGVEAGTITNWIALGLYLAVGFFALLRARDEAAIAARNGAAAPRFWLGASVVVFALGFNKVFDVVSFLTDAGRCTALEQGWYGGRRDFQIEFVVATVMLGGAAFAAAAWGMRRNLRGGALGLAGVTILVFYTILRSASFHGVDAAIKRTVAGLSVNAAIEIAALALVIAGAHLARRPPRY
jgi:hypothetical protein